MRTTPPACERLAEQMLSFDLRWLGKRWVRIVVDGRRWHVGVTPLEVGTTRARRSGKERVVRPEEIRAGEGASSPEEWAWKAVRRQAIGDQGSPGHHEGRVTGPRRTAVAASVTGIARRWDEGLRCSLQGCVNYLIAAAMFERMIAARKLVSEEDYLRLELELDGRYEFDDGEVFAMTGAEPTHGQVVTSLSAMLRAGVRSKDGFLWSQDQRVRGERRYYYPDLVIACGRPKFADDKPASLLNPTVIIEVLSETTAQRDVGKKRKGYQQIASLQQYVIVDCPEPSVLLWNRAPDGRWNREEIDEGEVEIAGVTLRLPNIYEGVAALADAMSQRFEESE